MTSLTADIGRFVSELALGDVSAAALDFARVGFTDCFGVMVAGSRDPLIPLLDRELSSADGPQKAPLIPGGALRNVEDVALINGVAAHVLDYDDVTSDGHPSAVLVPAILAQGAASGANGADMLLAYAAGYEIWAELFSREPMPLYAKGWHPTAVRGTVGAAVACAKLLKLGPTETSSAIALSSSLAAGLVSNFGTMTKSFHVGRAAQSGLLAARLAGKGMTASIDALEHDSGYLVAFSPSGECDRTRPFVGKGREWLLERNGLNVKRYPICYATHRAIDGALRLVEKFDLKPADIDRIDVSMGEFQARMLRNTRPVTGLEAKFSMEFAMASSVVARKVGLTQLTDGFVQDPLVQGLFERVSCETTSELAPGTAFAPTDSVVIRTVGGRTLESGPIAHAKGSLQAPLSREELWIKFSDCLGDSFAETARSRVFERLIGLEQVGGVGDLLELR